MGLISVQFTLFIGILLLFYYLVPKNQRWIVLLVGSYGYYLINCNKYVIYLLVTTATTYCGARKMDELLSVQKQTVKEHRGEWTRAQLKEYKAKNLLHRKRIMLAVLLFNFGILGFLKYFEPAALFVIGLFRQIGWDLTLPGFAFLLPLGISFYTFQSMGYLIDVYQEKIPAEKNPARFALFVSFFPQMIQGPIALYDQLAEQLYEGHDFQEKNMKDGLLLILWGVFKKVVIADRAVIAIDYMIENQEIFSGTFMFFAILLYALQLYADFSGGIDIVRGIGQLFGITMEENFRRPYFSKSLTEYWHRWHITLGNWVRNYVFYPLSISRTFLNMGKWMKTHVGKHIGKVLPTGLASLITFLIIGIWHGANSKYIAFGAWNGIVILLGELMRPVFDKMTEAFGIKRETRGFQLAAIGRTFCLVLIGYYFDVAYSLQNALEMMWKTFTDFHMSEIGRLGSLALCGLDSADFMILLVGAVVIFICSYIQEKTGQQIREILAKKSIPFQWTVVFAVVFAVIIFGYYGPGIDPAEFVYMQF